MNRYKSATGVAVVLLAAMTGCAKSTTVKAPDELVAARQEYQRASSGLAATYDPAQLQQARHALDKAESAWRNHADPVVVRDYSYMAQRSAQIAEARGQTGMTVADRNQTVTMINAVQLQKQQEAMRATAQQQGATETQALPRDEVMEKLGRLSNVTSEPGRGVVITLSSPNMFEDGTARIRALGRSQLDDVANALTQIKDRDIRIETFTDEAGSDLQNFQLAKRRAEAVRAYLARKGVNASRLIPIGVGKSMSPSTSARRESRRVEIVVKPQ
jgi:outer membrane protein OmpA-like peptidoglycan-associated protein